MTEKRYIHCQIATNFRMTNIQAAFLYDQLNDIDNILNIKKNIFLNYDILFKRLVDKNLVKYVYTEDYTEHSKWMYSIIIPSKKYEDIENYMRLHNIEIRPIFYDIHEHYHLKNIKKDNDTIIDICGILLPSYPDLLFENQKYIVDTLYMVLNTI